MKQDAPGSSQAVDGANEEPKLRIRKLAAVFTLFASTGLGASLMTAGTTAEAAGPVYSIPCVQGGLATATAAITAAAAVSPGVLSAGQFTFSFKAECSGGFRFLAKMEDGRPGKNNKSVVVATELTNDVSGSTLTINAALRPIGMAILKDAAANGKQAVLQLIAHQRPNGTLVSAEAIQFLLL